MTGVARWLEQLRPAAPRASTRRDCCLLREACPLFVLFPVVAGGSNSSAKDRRKNSFDEFQSGCGRRRDVIVHCGLRFDRPNVGYPRCLAWVFSRWRALIESLCRNGPGMSVAKKLTRRAATEKCAKVRERNTRLFTFAAKQTFTLDRIREKL